VAAACVLRQARALIEGLHIMFVSGQHVHGARVANEITGLIDDMERGLNALQRIQERDKG
jgi:hypothetical protein